MVYCRIIFNSESCKQSKFYQQRDKINVFSYTTLLIQIYLTVYVNGCQNNVEWTKQVAEYVYYKTIICRFLKTTQNNIACVYIFSYKNKVERKSMIVDDWDERQRDFMFNALILLKKTNKI